MGYRGPLQSLKWGVGKVVCDALKEDGTAPIVLPFYHSGMGDIMPRRARIPRVGKEVTITIGRPLDLRHITCRCQGPKPEEAWSQITAEIELALKELEKQVPPNRDQSHR